MDERRRRLRGDGARSDTTGTASANSDARALQRTETALRGQRPPAAEAEGHDRILYRPPAAPLCAQSFLWPASSRGGTSVVASPLATARSDAASDASDASVGVRGAVPYRRVRSGLRAARGRRAALEAKGVRVTYEEDEDGYYVERVVYPRGL